MFVLFVYSALQSLSFQNSSGILRVLGGRAAVFRSLFVFGVFRDRGGDFNYDFYPIVSGFAGELSASLVKLAA